MAVAQARSNCPLTPQVLRVNPSSGTDTKKQTTCQGEHSPTSPRFLWFPPSNPEATGARPRLRRLLPCPPPYPARSREKRPDDLNQLRMGNGQWARRSCGAASC